MHDHRRPSLFFAEVTARREGSELKDGAAYAELQTHNLVQTVETWNQVHSRKSYFRSPLWVLNWATPATVVRASDWVMRAPLNDGTVEITRKQGKWGPLIDLAQIVWFIWVIWYAFVQPCKIMCLQGALERCTGMNAAGTALPQTGIVWANSFGLLSFNQRHSLASLPCMIRKLINRIVLEALRVRLDAPRCDSRGLMQL